MRRETKPTVRNVPDDVLARLTGNGGVCMVTFVPGFVSQECADWLAGLKAEAARRGLDPRDFGHLFSFKAEWKAAHPVPRATLAQVADHVEHVRSWPASSTWASAATSTAPPT